MNSLTRKAHAFKNAVAFVVLSGAVALANAQTDPLTDALDGVSLTGVAAAVGALVLAIIGIAMAFKGADVAKRAVRKV